MGSVEAAAEELPDGTTRVVALKRILRAGAAGADAPRVEMFLRESRLTTLLDHPNVVRSLAYGETDGELFLAMEYVAGEPLSRLLAAAGTTDRAEKLPLPVIAYILAEACEGLHAAHELRGPNGEPLGVVHRDISPQNVMVGYDGTVKLLDFGVAKIDLLDCAAKTKTGEVKGKTAYMSPEQAMGETLDRRSDLYSLGTVLFECVAGRRMWGAGTDLDVLRKLALEEPPSLAGAVRDVPAKLSSLFARLVERDRTKRPDTAHDLAIVLRDFASSPGSSGAPCADATSLRAAMSRLFPDECARREAALEQALASEVPTGPRTTPLPSISPGVAAAGESGPVFVTHHGLAQQAPGRPGRQSAALASLAAVALLSAAFGIALHYRSPRSAGDPASSGLTSTEGPQPTSLASASAAVPSAPGAVAPPTTPAAPLGSTPPPLVAETHKPAQPVRHVFVPHVGPNVTPAPPAASTPSHAPVRPPEPPDVDPTPF